MNHETIPTQIEHTIMNDFKLNCLESFRSQLQERTYPGYPRFQERLFIDADDFLLEPIHLPDGVWETSGGALPSIREQHTLAAQQHRFDRWGRPLHPWFNEMAEDPLIGVLTGKGFYWNWGPNYTADAVVLRHDLDTPHVLLIQRSDTGQWALPGGFIDPGEDALTASIRELREETFVDLTSLKHAAQPTYTGPLADLRTTANAWPETTVFRFDMPYQMTTGLAMKYSGSAESPIVAWLPLDSIDEHLFGSHRALLELSTD